MRSLLFLLALFGLALFTSQATARYGYENGQRVWYVEGPEAIGGDPEYFIQSVNGFRKDRTKVVLGRSCLSSCTLYTALLKDGLLCARPGARLIFHRYVVVKNRVIEGGVLKSFDIVGPVQKLDPHEHKRIMNVYPYHVKREVFKRRPAGFPRHGQELYIPATDLGIPTCKRPG